MLHGSVRLEIGIWNMFDCQVHKAGREQWSRVGQYGLLLCLRALSCWEQRLFSLCSSERRCTDRAGRAAEEPYSTRMGALCHQATTRTLNDWWLPNRGSLPGWDSCCRISWCHSSWHSTAGLFFLTFMFSVVTSNISGSAFAQVWVASWRRFLCEILSRGSGGWQTQKMRGFVLGGAFSCF